MSTFDDLYSGRFLAASDLKGPVTATIERIEEETFEQTGKPARRKAVLYFRKARKPVILNKTNAITLAAAFGKDFRNWPGKDVLINPEPVLFAGKSTQGIRLYPANGAGRITSGPINPPE